MTIVASGRYGKGRQAGPGCHAALGLACFAILWAQAAAPALASHQGHGSHAEGERHGIVQSEYAVPGASFRVFAERGRVPVDEAADDEAMQAAATTVVDSLAIILERRS
ncbi:MAG TPA: hypothetical protein VFS39_14350, partial [Nitrospira sp.]|nr:hypothetical protein [Nitrospira sp.]